MYRTDRDLFPDYPATLSLIRKLACDSYSSSDDGNRLELHYPNPKGVIVLTMDELMAMNRPDFITPYQKDPAVLTKEDVLAAIKGEFGKEISYWKK